jgi:hypothetical protein
MEVPVLPRSGNTFTASLTPSHQTITTPRQYGIGRRSGRFSPLSGTLDRVSSHGYSLSNLLRLAIGTTLR